MARSLEIPAVVGAGVATTTIQDGDILIVDGLSGQVFVNPTADMIVSYQEKSPKLSYSTSGMVDLSKRTNGVQRRCTCRASR
ncbi:PEP-utilizing enzyme [Lysinibacillus sp. MHQ-1]|nr:PEP-utilizing enzyme [Lysinibacillus sp. MHQ-1]